MAISVAGTVTSKRFSTTGTLYQSTDHTVTSGTDALLVVITQRGYTAGAARTLTVRWNYVSAGSPGQLLTELFNNQDSDIAYQDPCAWIGIVNAPATGLKTLRIEVSDTNRGCNVYFFNLVGSKTSGWLGNIADQVTVGTVGNTAAGTITNAQNGSIIVSWNSLTGVAPSVSGSSLTPATDWVDVDSGPVGTTTVQVGVIRYRLPTSITSHSVTTTFSESTDDRGGVIFEILPAAGSQALTAAGFTNANSFPVLSVSQRLSAAGFTNSNSFPSLKLNLRIIAGSAAASGNSFPALTLTTGAVALTVGAFANQNQFPDLVVSGTSQPQTLTALTFTNANQFPALVVQPGVAQLTAGAFVNANTFPTLQVNMGMAIFLAFANQATFPDMALSMGGNSGATIQVGPYANQNSFPDMAVSQTTAFIGGAARGFGLDFSKYHPRGRL